MRTPHKHSTPTPPSGELPAHGIRERFRQFAHHAAIAVGSPWAFVIAILIIIAWAITGPLFGFSDTWQLVINTGTTIITFLIVFLIQNTQNRDTRTIHLKLDELIYKLREARNRMVDLEEASDEELAQFEEEFRDLRRRRQPGHEPERQGPIEKDRADRSRPGRGEKSP